MTPRTRRALRVSAANALAYTGVLAARRALRRTRGKHRETCVLGLHRVLNDADLPRANSLEGIILREQTFARLLEHLARSFHVVSLEEFVSGGAANGSKPSCLITFDDGWRDNFTTAFPLLKQHGLPATILLATGLLDGGETFWVERLRAACRSLQKLNAIEERVTRSAGKTVRGLDQIIEKLKHMSSDRRVELLSGIADGPAGDGDQMLTWAEVREMAAHGIDFGGHTDTHPLLPYEKDAVIDLEVRTCKQKVEAATGKPVRAFAYPNGDWDARARASVQAAGYQCAFTTRSGWHSGGADPFTIPRVLLHEGCVVDTAGRFSPRVLEFHLTGWR